jgi:hypothetical protein
MVIPCDGAEYKQAHSTGIIRAQVVKGWTGAFPDCIKGTLQQVVISDWEVYGLFIDRFQKQ